MSKVTWNKDHTASVVLDKIKEFTIDENLMGEFRVHGWYNKENFFSFGTFPTITEAQHFLQNIHNILMT